VLTDKVKPALEDVEAENSYTYVYDVYRPLEYVRREKSGGLADKNLMFTDVTVSGGGVDLLFAHLAEENEKFSAHKEKSYLIQDIGFPETYDFYFPPLHQNPLLKTKEYVKGKPFVQNLLSKAFRAAGFKVKIK
jgi:hypothetical protein